MWLCLFLFFSCESGVEETQDPPSGAALSLPKVILAFESTALPAKLSAEKEDLESRLSEKLNRLAKTTVSADTTDLAGSFRSGKIDLAFLSPRNAVPLLDQKVASIFLVRLPGDKPEKSIWLCKKEKNYADISEAKGKAIAFANRASDPGCLIPIRDLSKKKPDWIRPGADRLFLSGHLRRRLRLDGKKSPERRGGSHSHGELRVRRPRDEKTKARLRIFQNKGRCRPTLFASGHPYRPRTGPSSSRHSWI